MRRGVSTWIESVVSQVSLVLHGLLCGWWAVSSLYFDHSFMFTSSPQPRCRGYLPTHFLFVVHVGLLLPLYSWSLDATILLWISIICSFSWRLNKWTIKDVTVSLPLNSLLFLFTQLLYVQMILFTGSRKPWYICSPTWHSVLNSIWFVSWLCFVLIVLWTSVLHLWDTCPVVKLLGLNDYYVLWLLRHCQPVFWNNCPF